jgi:hypothetical protein|nr:glycosyltransferase [Prosthecobacter sp.]
MNPGWELRYYTDEDCVRWIKERCPRLLPTYLSFPTGIHRADFLRILVLYFDGGVYADVDIECIRPLDELLQKLDSSKSVFLTRDHPIHERIHFSGRTMWMNDFMIAEPGNDLIGEILIWMTQSPASSKSSANAVLETGPGVITSVIEMLGGAQCVHSLGAVPSTWVHFLPDLTCAFEEAHYYRGLIRSRQWLQRETYVVHYWFHTWLGDSNGNTLTKNADVLLSTIGEQTERKLQWYLRDAYSETDNLIACALAEFAEAHGTIILWVDRAANAVMDRFLEVLKMVGLKPKLLMLASGDTEGIGQRVQNLKDQGATLIRAAQLSQAACNGLGSKVLLVADPDANLDEERAISRHIQHYGGFVLGPAVEWAKALTEGDGVTLSEVYSTDQRVPRIVHLLPDHGLSVTDLAETLAEYEFSLRQWTTGDTQRMLEDMSMGVWDLSLTPKEEQQLLCALAILYVHGGVMFQGVMMAFPEQLHRDCRTSFCHGKDHWLLACPPKSEVVAGAIQHWQLASRKGMACNVKQFLQERISTLFRLGHVRDLHASHIKEHPLLP